MAGRVLEESLESCNAVVADVKRVLRSMPKTTGRLKKVNERLQGNLKKEVVKDRVMIEEKYTGAKRNRYRPRKRYDNGTKVISSVLGTKTYKGETFDVLPDGSWLRKAMFSTPGYYDQVTTVAHQPNAIAIFLT